MRVSPWLLVAAGLATAQLGAAPPALAQSSGGASGASTGEAGTYLQSIVAKARDLLDNEPRNPALAAELLTEAAKAGSADAMILLARLYTDGDGVERDYAAAEDPLNRAAAAGSVAVASVALAELYRNAEPPFRDPAKAVGAYETAIALGDASAMLSLARMLADGEGVPVDFERARTLLEGAIAAGAAKDGWAALASLYADADDEHRDLVKAAEAYQQAADLGDAWAMISLAQMLGQGDGVPADFERAKALLDQAIAAGLPGPAGKAAGDLFWAAPPELRDETAALSYYELAAAAGDGPAHLAVAEIQAKGANPGQAQASIAGHLAAAADLIGAADVARTMFNVSPAEALYIMVQSLLVDQGYRLQVDGVYGGQTQGAITRFCAEKGLGSCQSAIITLGVLTELLDSAATDRRGA